MARHSTSLPKKGEPQSVWKKLAKELNFPESYVSITLGFLVVIIGGILLFNYFNRSSLPGLETDRTVSNNGAQKINQVKESTHLVATKETLWSISEKYYGTGFKWHELAKANNLADPNRLEAGTTIVIPTAVPVVQNKDILADSTQRPKSYTVAKGESLWKIAVSQYGDGYAWVKIAQENNLTHPNVIHPGNVLKIP